MRKIREDRRSGMTIRDLAKKYDYERSTMGDLVAAVPVEGAAEKKEKNDLVREIMKNWRSILPPGEEKVGVPRPTALKIYEIMVFIERYREYAHLLDNIRTGKMSIRRAHKLAVLVLKDYEDMSPRK
jgi:predicted PilT family ATPase